MNNCPYPWTSLYLNYDGEISPCCFHYPIANIRDNKELYEVWNCKELQTLREHWADGDLKGTPCSNCPGLKANGSYDYPIKHKPKDIYLDNVERNRREFDKESLVLFSKPVEVLYVPSTWCNYDCIHCCQPRYDGTDKTHVPTRLLFEFYDTFGCLAVRHMFSGGEPLGLKNTYKIIDRMPLKQKKSSELVVLTNGSLIPKVWDKLEGFNCYQFEISIASFDVDIYQKIHGVSIDKLETSLAFLNNKKHNTDIKIIRIIALMKSNFDGLYIKVGVDAFNIDETWILPTHSSDGRNRMLLKENIFSFPVLLNRHWDRVIGVSLDKNKNSVVTYKHLVYIASLLPKSRFKAWLISIKSFIMWYVRVIVLSLFKSPSMVRGLKKLKIRWNNK